MVTDFDIAEIESELAERGISPSELCRRADIHVSTWWRWRNGRYEPQGASARKLRRALDEIRKSTKRGRR
jgi:hypothetical protein